MRESIGFVGLGQMGQPIAFNLLRAIGADHDLRVFDVQEERLAPLLALGAAQAFRLADVARPGGLVFSMVPNNQALLQIALGEGGLLSQLKQGGIHVSLSTILPSVARELAQVYTRHGSTFVAAAVLGRPDAAAEGKLSVLVSGDALAKERVMPLLAQIGTRVFDLGEQIEGAMVAKLAANFLMGVNHEAQGQAAALVEAGGLDRGRFLSMLVATGLFGGAVFAGYGQMIGARDFSPALFPVDYGLKDLRQAREFATEKHVPLSYADAPLTHLQAALDAGRGAEDWAVLSEFVNEPVSHPETEAAEGTQRKAHLA